MEGPVGGATLAENNLEMVLASFAADVRQFVANLQRPRLPDTAWVNAARRRCQELVERVAELKQELTGCSQAVPEAITDLRETLAHTAAALRHRINREQFKRLQKALFRRYEDFLAQVRALKLWRPGLALRVRSLRLPSWTRSVFHAFMGLSGVLLYQFVLARETILWMLSGLLLTFIGLDVSRRFSARFNSLLVDKMFKGIVRPQERYRIPSASWYLLALFAVVLLIPRPAACAAVMILALADPIASLVGSRTGTIKLHNDKSLQGSLAFLLTGFVAAGAYLLLAGPLTWPMALAAAASMAAVGAFVELYSDALDDNFSVPVACALTALLFL